MQRFGQPPREHWRSNGRDFGHGSRGRRLSAVREPSTPQQSPKEAGNAGRPGHSRARHERGQREEEEGAGPGRALRPTREAFSSSAAGSEETRSRGGLGHGDPAGALAPGLGSAAAGLAPRMAPRCPRTPHSGRGSGDPSLRAAHEAVVAGPAPAARTGPAPVTATLRRVVAPGSCTPLSQPGWAARGPLRAPEPVDALSPPTPTVTTSCPAGPSAHVGTARAGALRGGLHASVCECGVWGGRLGLGTALQCLAAARPAAPPRKPCAGGPRSPVPSLRGRGEPTLAWPVPPSRAGAESQLRACPAAGHSQTPLGSPGSPRLGPASGPSLAGAGRAGSTGPAAEGQAGQAWGCRRGRVGLRTCHSAASLSPPDTPGERCSPSTFLPARLSVPEGDSAEFACSLPCVPQDALLNWYRVGLGNHTTKLAAFPEDRHSPSRDPRFSITPLPGGQGFRMRLVGTRPDDSGVYMCGVIYLRPSILAAESPHTELTVTERDPHSPTERPSPTPRPASPPQSLAVSVTSVLAAVLLLLLLAWGLASSPPRGLRGACAGQSQDAPLVSARSAPGPWGQDALCPRPAVWGEQPVPTRGWDAPGVGPGLHPPRVHRRPLLPSPQKESTAAGPVFTVDYGELDFEWREKTPEPPGPAAPEQTEYATIVFPGRPAPPSRRASADGRPGPRPLRAEDGHCSWPL
ncbi:Programmed cell death protein 1 [Galemys pyrenaicus]|uniref:Programmed cell death protein 1 n=1 Tax=Galemys pyrenaicus TaxID=202257 RepID=A0A8J5ZVN3_GALPY|nr:Programmed cell death protein 1 [Galemys pyrenaicus]